MFSTIANSGLSGGVLNESEIIKDREPARGGGQAAIPVGSALPQKATFSMWEWEIR
jgi:hypothetical protein